MPEETPTTKILRVADLDRERTAGFQSIYVNHTEAVPSFYDLTLMFCRISRSPKRALIIEEQVATTMSWEHALRARDLLIRMVKAYEAEHGPIRIMEENPPDEAQASGAETKAE